MTLSSIVTREAIATAAAAYRSATPFPHVVLDGWFTDHALRQLWLEFARPAADWHQYEDHKRGLMALTDHPVVQDFQAGTVLAIVQAITGQSDLVSDPTLRGGGLHAVARGGRLGIHTDFNRHPELPLRRAVNTLLYLNRAWDPAWQGALTLTDRADPPTTVTLQPIWNRWVIFGSSATSWHGHPEPLACPDPVERRSLAIYYYVPLTDVSAESLVFHSTQYADADADDV